MSIMKSVEVIGKPRIHQLKNIPEEIKEIKHERIQY